MEELKIFFYAGIAFLVAGSFFVSITVGIGQPPAGFGFVLGCILILTGIVLIILTLPSKNRSRELGQEYQTAKLSASRTQLVVAIIVTAGIFLGFFLVYPVGILYGYIDYNTSSDYPPYESIKGLEIYYKMIDLSNH